MEPKKSRDPLYITIIILLLGGGGFFAWSYYQLKTDFGDLEKQYSMEKSKNDTLSRMLEANGMVDLSGQNTIDNLQFMLDSYAELKTSNAGYMDSIASQKEKIANLIEEVKRGKGNAYALMKAQKEAETLRKIMKDYIHTIDSLNTANQGLVADIKVKDQKITEVSTERDEVINKNKNLEEKVAKGSVLQAGGLSTTALRIRSGGKQVETTKAGRTDMIKTCMTIMENRIARPGTREIYMVVITPGGSILSDNPSVTVNTEDGAMPFSLKREVEYQNSNLDLCMYAQVKEGIELAAGTYIVKIYADKAMIGKSSFTLK